MDKQAILADLRAQFGKKSVLYAADLAELLGKSEQALANLRHRGGLTLPVKPVGGRPAVSIYAVVDWLADGEPIAPKSAKAAPKGSPPISTPARMRASLGKALLAFRTQRDFLEDTFSRLEAIQLDLEMSEADSKKT